MAAGDSQKVKGASLGQHRFDEAFPAGELELNSPFPHWLQPPQHLPEPILPGALPQDCGGIFGENRPAQLTDDEHRQPLAAVFLFALCGIQIEGFPPGDGFPHGRRGHILYPEGLLQAADLA